MKKNFILFFLFLKELILTSTFRILGEKDTSVQITNNNDFIRLPYFYLNKIIRNDYKYFNSSSNYQNEHKNILQEYFYNIDDKSFYRDVISYENKYSFKRNINNQKFLPTIDNMKQTFVDPFYQKANNV